MEVIVHCATRSAEVIHLWWQRQWNQQMECVQNQLFVIGKDSKDLNGHASSILLRDKHRGRHNNKLWGDSVAMAMFFLFFVFTSQSTRDRIINTLIIHNYWRGSRPHCFVFFMKQKGMSCFCFSPGICRPAVTVCIFEFLECFNKVKCESAVGLSHSHTDTARPQQTHTCLSKLIKGISIYSPYCTLLHYLILYNTILYWTKLYYTMLYCTILDILYCAKLFYTILYYTIQFYNVLFYIILY